MDPLPIPLLLPVKNRILIPRSHLVLARHFLLPPLDTLRRLAQFPQRAVHGRDDGVHEPQAFALARFLGGGQAPGDFPAGRGWGC